jgi:fatty acid desaturase
VTEKRIEWYRSPIEKNRLIELTRRSDAKALLHSGSFLLIYLASISLNLFFFLHRLWIPMLAGSYLHAMFVDFMGMGAAVHELSHRTAFRTKWLNTFFYRLFAFLTWNNPLHFKESHNRHHQYTYFRGLDREQVADPIPFSRAQVLSWFLFDWTRFRKFMWANLNHAAGNTRVDFFFWCPLVSAESVKGRQLVRWARILLIGHLLLLGLFIWLKLWILIFLITFSYFFATFLQHATALIQHTGLQGDVPDWRFNSYTVNLNPLLRYLYWNMNFHTEHHMYAGVPFYNLPALRKELAWDLQLPMPGLIATLRHILKVKRAQKDDPGYRSVPRFPETATLPGG